MSLQHNATVRKFLPNLNSMFLALQNDTRVQAQHEPYFNSIAQRLVEAKLLGGSGLYSNLPAVAKRINAIYALILHFEVKNMATQQGVVEASILATLETTGGKDALVLSNAYYQLAHSLYIEAEKGLLDVGQTIAAIDAIFDLQFYLY
jgi:hypothetical protein